MKNKFKWAATFILLAASQGIHAQGGGWSCWADASNRYNVPVDLLYAVARVETGNKSGVVGRKNSNGSYDIGLMQINSAHLPMLKQYGITKEVLLSQPCINLHVGAWIMSNSIARHGYNWRGVGAYNAGSDSKRIVYANKVIRMYQRILAERGSVAVMPNMQAQLSQVAESAPVAPAWMWSANTMTVAENP